MSINKLARGDGRSSILEQALGGVHAAANKMIKTNGGAEQEQEHQQPQYVEVESIVATVHIDEIDQGVFGSAGTGATTWEASIAMPLYFESHLDELQGDVLELGSGVGLGAIMTQSVVEAMVNREQLFFGGAQNVVTSVTLSDVNAEVLRQCERNLQTNGLFQTIKKFAYYLWIGTIWTSQMSLSTKPLTPLWPVIVSTCILT